MKPSADTLLPARIRECVDKIGNGNEFSRLSGINRRTLDYYMSGTSEPKANALAAIANCANVSLDWLICGREQKTAPLNEINANLLAEIITLVDAELALVNPVQKAALCAKIYAYVLKKEAAENISVTTVDLLDIIEILKPLG